MPLTKAALEFPFTSAAVIEIHASGAGGAKYAGTVYLISTATHNRRDIVLGAGHNLTHLSVAGSEALVTFYGNRDVNSIAVRADDRFRYATAGTGMPNDFGVAVLSEPLPDAIGTIPLRTPEDATTFPGTVAGGVADKVTTGDRAIYQDTAEFHSHGGLLYCAAGVTAQGMSGGPVLHPATGVATAVGAIHGTGTVTPAGGAPQPADLAVAFTAANISAIDGLIDAALA